jgi:uncharacterized protein with NRDE domain
LALFFHVFNDCPLLVAANRDEHYDRASAPPSLWRTKPAMIAGKDLLAGGTWLGVNETGLVVGILNRRLNSNEARHVIPPRSRGLFCLDLLGLKNTAEARAFVQAHQASYQPFTVVFADSREAWMAYNDQGEIMLQRLGQELHVFSNTADFDVRSEKLNRAYRQFAQLTDALRLNPGDRSRRLHLLARVLGDHTLSGGSADPKDAICMHGDVSGTVSSSVIFFSQEKKQFHSYYSPGPPCRTSFGEPLSLDIR